jgi:Spy/CpxP family protein refolding chaperone
VISKLMLPLLSATALLAQNPNLPDLKAVLGLSDAQIQSLGQLEQQKAQAVQPIAQHIQQDQQQLDTLLQSSSPDPVAVGKLIIEISTLGRQVQQILNNSQTQAANLLTPDQKAKLQTLSQVLVLQLAAQQAANLGLVSPPPSAPAATAPANPAPQ